MSLLDDLEQAESENTFARPCQACETLAAVPESEREGVKRALAGTIGERKLAAILTGHGYPTGRRAINRHRLEGHP